MPIVVSAPGKIHLMGEHAVVYGKPALLAAVNLRLWVTVRPGKGRIEAPNVHVEEYMRHVLDIVARMYTAEPFDAWDFSLRSDIPFGYHLGSSAAVAVATSAAFLYAAKNLWDKEATNRCAFEAEKKQHGNPSGGDNTAVTYGGFVLFRKTQPNRIRMRQLDTHPSACVSDFLLVNTGKPEETTGEMVGLVRLRHRENSAGLEKAFCTNETQTNRIIRSLQDGNCVRMQRAIREGQRTLEAMGVVSDKAKKCIRDIEKAGGAAKILGGGGKKGAVGFILCYSRQPQAMRRSCKRHGYTVLPVRLGEEGVRLEGRQEDRQTNTV